MELIHATEDFVDKRYLHLFDKWDVVGSLYDKADENDFQLIIPEAVWLERPINKNHFLYEPGTEFGGIVLGIRHIGSSIEVNGRTWRGMLIDKIVKPPGGSAYKTITSMEANAAIADLVGSSLFPFFAVSAAASGITVSGSFRYQTLYKSLVKMLGDSDARLKITVGDRVVELSAEPIVDLSGNEEFSQDLGYQLTASDDSSLAYNHIIALGSGQLLDRQVVELYRQDDGTINSTPLASDIYDRQIVLDYPNVESIDELTSEATTRLAVDYTPVQKIEIDLPDNTGLSLGDIVGGRDYVTGQSIAKQITQIIRTVDDKGTTVQYKVGD